MRNEAIPSQVLKPIQGELRLTFPFQLFLSSFDKVSYHTVHLGDLIPRFFLVINITPPFFGCPHSWTTDPCIIYIMCCKFSCGCDHGALQKAKCIEGGLIGKIVAQAIHHHDSSIFSESIAFPISTSGRSISSRYHLPQSARDHFTELNIEGMLKPKAFQKLLCSEPLRFQPLDALYSTQVLQLTNECRIPVINASPGFVSEVTTRHDRRRKGGLSLLHRGDWRQYALTGGCIVKEANKPTGHVFNQILAQFYIVIILRSYTSLEAARLTLTISRPSLSFSQSHATKYSRIL